MATELDVQFSSFTLGYIASLLVYVFSITITPGPNNLMVTASGMNFGYRKTLPHIFGITAGCLALMMLIAAGLGALFVRFPLVHLGLKIFGSIYLLWLAYKIFTAETTLQTRDDAQPLNIYQAFLFQFVNPKAWTMGITSISAFSLSNNMLVSLVVVIGVQTAMIFPCCSLWALIGEKIHTWAKNPNTLVWFNRVLGVLTASCVLALVQ